MTTTEARVTMAIDGFEKDAELVDS